MNKRDLTKALKEIKAELNIDFVRSDYGYCCRTCADFKSTKIHNDFLDAKTYIIAVYFLGGMNYNGPFKEQKRIFLNWRFNPELMDRVTEILVKYFEVVKPENAKHSLVITEKKEVF